MNQSESTQGNLQRNASAHFPILSLKFIPSVWDKNEAIVGLLVNTCSKIISSYYLSVGLFALSV